VITLGVAVALLYTERQSFENVLFETVSAFGTVGLSTGITAGLTPAGKLWVSLLMFIGRLGPLTLAFAFLLPRRASAYRHAEEAIMIG
jgi:trk system potassium uptake protein TrkH